MFTSSMYDGESEMLRNLLCLSIACVVSYYSVATATRGDFRELTVAEQEAVVGRGYDMDCEDQPFGKCAANGKARPGLIACPPGTAVGASCGQPAWCPGGQPHRGCTKITAYGFDCVAKTSNCPGSETACSANGTCGGTVDSTACGTYPDCDN